ncbi:MAG: hypothetical protein J6B43_13150 [Lachnospiraceae bacterium]|nr:hypothetical protein [Lachnospiraceae bacterium]
MSNTTFTIENYEKKAPFAGFLPGLAGVHGIPIWCYYVNRGQCISSFGVEDKDHAIMEFFPAQQSYEHTPLRGFRTFVKRDGEYLELFSGEETDKKMHVEMNGLCLEENDRQHGLHTTVNYFILPEEKAGALVRKVTITNTAPGKVSLQVLDGMPVLLPYGVDMGSIKEMGHTAKAWMQAENVKTGVPYFRLRASMADTACVTAIAGGNYGFGCDEEGQRLQAVTDPSLVFGYDTSMQRAVGFRDREFADFLSAEQVNTNQYPCCFFAREGILEEGGSLVLYEMIGQVKGKELLDRILSVRPDAGYFERKRELAAGLPQELCRVMDTRTADPAFDAYSRYTYMDNVLRGGFPIRLPGDKIFYVYSRKHGDLERDYNYFRMLPEFYSQGNGNFRDVNQNRRCDTFFTPYVGTENIVKFYGLIQLDGYNPLAVEKVTYTLEEEKAGEIFDAFTQEQKEELLAFLGRPFTPGAFFAKLDELGIRELDEEERWFAAVMEQASPAVNADFGEGYWSDHWTYNLDLIENYLRIYPEKEKALLLNTPIPFYRSQAAILPRRKRYVRTENGIRQYRFLDETKKAPGGDKLLRDRFGKGEVLEVTLLEKLILLCVTKYAALDAYGCGVEMEGGKPGWYDALNGLPGLFGSSMAETYELSRLLCFTIAMVRKYRPDLEMLAELAQLLSEMEDITLRFRNDIVRESELLEFWKQRNDAKEAYWEKTFGGISGAKTAVDSGRLLSALEHMQETVQAGIRKACKGEGEICPAYFTYEVREYTEDKDGIYPEHFEQKKVPLFLEGPVRFLKLDGSREDKKALYRKVKDSDLYDAPLQMYKVNASLQEASIELGRAKAFTPGWLENESIWLHMEYKYLLELLGSGMYEEFAEDFHNAAIPFLDPQVYGRSIYENSSFIASSKNPDRSCHGRGFVARLSGSTVEFLSMWIGMMFGKLFTVEDGSLTLTLTPVLPAYLVGEGRRVEAMLLGTTKVIYELEENRDYFPGNYRVEQMELTYLDGSRYRTTQDRLTGALAEDVRGGRVTQIVVKLI